MKASVDGLGIGTVDSGEGVDAGLMLCLGGQIGGFDSHLGDGVDLALFVIHCIGFLVSGLFWFR